MEKLIKYFQKDRILANMIRGIGVGLILWILHLVVYRIFGLEPALYNNVSDLMLGGMILGAVIGMISSEVAWHKENHPR